MKGEKIMFLAIIVFTLFILFGGYNFFNEIKKRIICKFVTKGIVVDIFQEPNKNTKFPIFEYEVNGKKYTKQSNYGNVSIPYTIGDEVDIYFNNGNPNEHYIKGNFGAIIISIIFFAVGLAGLAFVILGK